MIGICLRQSSMIVAKLEVNMEHTWVTVDGNEAVANVAHALSEVIVIMQFQTGSAGLGLNRACSYAGGSCSLSCISLMVSALHTRSTNLNNLLSRTCVQ